MEEEYFKRATLEQIACPKESKTYHQQDMDSFVELETIMQNLDVPEETRTELDYAVMHHMYIARNIHTEIGMKIGARLLFQLLFEDEKRVT